MLPFIFQVTIFRQYPDLWSVIGCALIIGAMLTVMMVRRPSKTDDMEMTLETSSTLGSYSRLNGEEEEEE